MWKDIQKRLQSSDAWVSIAIGLAVVLIIGVFIRNYFAKTPLSTTSPSEDELQTEQITKLPASHTVVAGETLWIIAEKYYNSGYNWVDIKKANSLVDADYIEVGQSLTIPSAAPIKPQMGQISSTSVEMKQDVKTYTVSHGDTLWDIAVKQYGDGFKWSAIAEANHLMNPRVIHAGNVLTLP